MFYLKVINKDALKEKPKSDDPNNDDINEEAAKKLEEFTKKHEKEIKEFGMLSRPDDSKRYLEEHPFLVCDETANNLVIWCLDLAMEEVSFPSYYKIPIRFWCLVFYQFCSKLFT